MGGVKSLEMIKLRKEIWDYLLSLGIAITNRGKSRTAATSKMELFLIIVNYWKPLTINTKSSILDVAAVLDPALTTEYFPSKLIIIADRESREKVDSSEWKLDSKVFQGLVQLMGNLVVDLFASRLNYQLTQYMETGSIQSGQMRCIRLVSGLRVYLSPLLLYKQNFTEGRARKNDKHVVDNIKMEQSVLVFIPFSNVNRNTSYPPKDKQSSQRSFTERTSFDHQQKSKVRGMENLSERLFLSGASRTGSSFIANPRKSSSTGNYESTWRKWVGWCHRRQIDPVSCEVTPVLDFLGERFNTGYEYRTIISHRSAISSYHQTIDGKGVGSIDKVCKILSVVFNLRPPQPNYNFIWNVQTVLEYIKVNWPVSNVLLDKLLFLKTFNAFGISLSFEGNSDSAFRHFTDGSITRSIQICLHQVT